MLALGLIVGDNMYEATDKGFVRFDNAGTSKGKGNAQATNISSMFTFTGWIYDVLLDISGPEGLADGVIDVYDVPLDYDGDLDIDADDFVLWQQAQQASGSATYYENEWILNIADLVVSEQNITNEGAKLLKVRFYPVATTVYQ